MRARQRTRAGLWAPRGRPIDRIDSFGEKLDVRMRMAFTAMKIWWSPFLVGAPPVHTFGWIAVDREFFLPFFAVWDLDAG